MDNIKGTVINEGGYFIVILDDGTLNFALHRWDNRMFFWPHEYDFQRLKNNGIDVYIVKDGELR